MGSAYVGVGGFTGGGLRSLMFNGQGSVGQASANTGSAGTIMLGADTHGIIAILMGALHTGSGGASTKIEGRYMLFHSLSDAFSELYYSGQMRSFDHGTLDCPDDN
jgi:hypothetical protein